MLKYILLVCLISSSFALNEEFLRSLWNKFKLKHGKTYLSDEHESSRLNIFRRNVDIIEKHNSEYSMGMHSFILGINQFADWTIEEFKQKLLGVRANVTSMREASTYTFMRLPKDVKVPDSVDWRTEGIVTDVKNQGECGSCWSFSTTGSLEGAHARLAGKLVSLSEQQLVDCSSKFGNNGCNGGLMDNAFEYIKENGGIETEGDYPYKAKDNKCHYDKTKIAATCTGFVDIPTGDEEALKEAVATIGPVSIAIDATQEKFMLYREGVFVDNTCSNGQDDLDHGVLTVGYGTTNGTRTGEKGPTDFWIVKNSWGAHWGELGYIRMARNLKNMCGIATAASYPLVK